MLFLAGTALAQAPAPAAEREFVSSGIKYRQGAYFMKQNGSRGGWLFISITTESEKASAQVRLSADRAK